MKPSATEVTLEQTMTMTMMKVIPVAFYVYFTALHSPQNDNDNGNDNGKGQRREGRTVKVPGCVSIQSDWTWNGSPPSTHCWLWRINPQQNTLFKFQDDKESKAMTSRVVKNSMRPLLPSYIKYIQTELETDKTLPFTQCWPMKTSFVKQFRGRQYAGQCKTMYANEGQCMTDNVWQDDGD